VPLAAERARRSVDALVAWIDRHGWAGFDPYDLRARPAFRRPGAVGGALRRLDDLAPWALRRALGVRPTVNAKAMALFADGFRRLYGATGDERHLDRAREALAWLEANASPGYNGLCWGYPFDWATRILVPRGTPSAVVTATAGQAFLGFWELTGEARYLDACRGICTFFTADLNRDEVGDGALCFSYTPLDRFHVHNANLMVAELLAQVGAATGDDGLSGLAARAAAYALGEQNADGSLCYWGRDQDTGCRIDHYHSGFEIRSLHAIWRVTGAPEVERAWRAYHAFYAARLFEDGTVPKLTPASTYPIDIHACAEAILCNSVLAIDVPAAAAILDRCLPWTLDHMQSPEGWFAHRILRLRGRREWRVAMPYMRWGQAWMLRALAEVVALDTARA